MERWSVFVSENWTVADYKKKHVYVFVYDGNTWDLQFYFIFPGLCRFIDGLLWFEEHVLSVPDRKTAVPAL